jgi:protein SCO1/2
MRLKTLAISVTLTTVAGLTIAAGVLLLTHTKDAGRSSSAASVAVSNASEARNGPFPEAYKRTAIAAPDFALVDQHGATVKLSELRGKVVVMSFAFAHCKAVCPTLVKTLIDASRQLDKDVATLLVTLDPASDTPATLEATSQTWQLTPSMHFLSGEPAAVTATLDAYEVPRGKDTVTGDLTHPALVYVIDREGRIAFTLNSPSLAWLEGAVRRAGAPGT